MAATGEGLTSWDYQLNGYLEQGAAGRAAVFVLLNAIRGKYSRLCDRAGTTAWSLHVMRVARDGTATDIPVKTWESSQTFTNHLYNGPRSKWGVMQTETFTGTASHSLGLISLITDSDQGVVMSWGVDERCNNFGPNTEVLVLINACVPAADEHLTRITNGALASDVVSGHNWGNPVALDLQLEDGTSVRRRQEGGTSTAVALEATEPSSGSSRRTHR